MADLLTAAIAQRLQEAFPTCRIYTEQEQDLSGPCFLILRTECTQTPFPSGRMRQTNAFDVRYIPAPPGSQGELSDMAMQLWQALETVSPADGPLRGTGMRAAFADGVLHFFVSFNLFVRHIKDMPHMEELDTDTNLKR